MRKQQPELFTTEGLTRRIEVTVIATLLFEQQLAENAFAEAAGLPPPHSHLDRRDTILGLNDDYVRYGISAGLHETYHLVRGFERAAAAQAVTQGRTSA